MKYTQMTHESLIAEKEALLKKYEDFCSKNLKLDMSRGKPSPAQLDISNALLDEIGSESNLKCENGMDCRNYGIADGIPEAKRLFAEILEVPEKNVIAAGNSSLNLMFDIIAEGMSVGFGGEPAWATQKGVKFLCPSPGYDRHFGVTEYFGIEMIPVDMTENGPDMNLIETLVKDSSVKGMWCVPKYSNPDGITYSDEVVKRLAALKPAAKDFRIIWDNAYIVHDLNDTPDALLNLYTECEKNGNEDICIILASTSKITFPGAGVAAMAASDKNIAEINKRMSMQSIGPDKLNQLRHVRMFPDKKAIMEQMKKQAVSIAPKFEVVLSRLENEIEGLDIGHWTKPNGGYFVSFYAMEGCAKRIVALCKEAGMVLTPAGAAFPYGNDPKDSNIRIAPTFPPVKELETAMDLFCTAVRLASCEKLLESV